jgi:hypothetical protein
MVIATTDEASTVLLSRRNPPFNGWVAIDEFEDLFFHLDNVRILSPLPRKNLPSHIGKIQNGLFGPFHRLKEFDTNAELLLVIARAPGDLRMIYSIANARRRFRYIAGYVIDSYFTEGFESSVKGYDHIFSTTQDGVDIVRAKFGVSGSILRQGFDCLTWANVDPARCIDLMGFGRQPPSFHREFQRSFHTSRSHVLYLHSPIGSVTGPAVWDERPMMLKLMQRSKMSLAFHLLVEPQGIRPRAAHFVTSRWFESLATGCVVVGKRPPGQMASEMFHWPNALIELPDLPSEATELIQTLSSDARFLQETRIRNVLEMCRQHDWRYRIRDIYGRFQLPLPERLRVELAALDELVNDLALIGQSSSTNPRRS